MSGMIRRLMTQSTWMEQWCEIVYVIADTAKTSPKKMAGTTHPIMLSVMTGILLI